MKNIFSELDYKLFISGMILIILSFFGLVLALTLFYSENDCMNDYSAFLAVGGIGFLLIMISVVIEEN